MHPYPGQLLRHEYRLFSTLGEIPHISQGTKYGRITGVAAASDLWEGSGTYTGFNATANESIEVFSGAAADAGTLRAVGAVDSGSQTSITDDSADFVSASVAAGDIFVNDTQAAHARVSAVTATTLTLDRMQGTNPYQEVINRPLDSYRVVATASTGAALVKLYKLLDKDFSQQTSKYVILNGVTGVAVTGTYARCSRVKVISAGSGGANAGILTVRQLTTTANIFAKIPIGVNKTLIGCDSVPNNRVRIISRLRIGMTRANGAAASGNITLKVRPRGEVFENLRSFDVAANAPVSYTSLSGSLICPSSDIKFRIESVSNAVTVEGAFEYEDIAI